MLELILPGVITRRDFLAQTGAAAASLAVGSAIRAPADATLDNGVLRASWSIAEGRLRAVQVTDLRAGQSLSLSPDVCTLVLHDGTTLGSSALRAGRVRRAGHALTIELADPEGRFSLTWQAELPASARYLRQQITLHATGKDVPIREVRLIDQELTDATVRGEVRGSPIVAGSWFLGFEHPLSDAVVAQGRARASLTRELPLRPGAPVVYSSVIGFATPGQLRRDFLTYLERERAHPYRPFLHYNSWYDIGYFSKFDETAALDAINAVGRELHEKRGVQLDSFLFDDGWDDPHTLWRFHSGFPRGFTPVRAAAERYGAEPGVWLSPWGGYVSADDPIFGL